MRSLSYISIVLFYSIFSSSLAQNENVEIAIKLKKEGKIEESIKKSLQIFRSEPQLSLKDSSRLCYNLAYSLQSIGDFEQALEYAKKAMYHRAKLNNASPNYFSLVRFFSNNEQYDSTIFYLKIHAAKQLKLTHKDDYSLAKTHNNIGFTYYLAGNLDSAEHYYKKVTVIQVKNKGYKDIVGLATGNLGKLYFIKKDYKNALINFQIDAGLTKNRIKRSYYNAILGIAECYLMLEEYTNAEKTMHRFLGNEVTDPRIMIRAYKLMSKILEKQKKNSKSAIYLRHYIHLTDSIHQSEKPNKELINQLSRNRINIIKSDLSLSENKVKLMNNELLLTKTKEKSERFKNRIYVVLLALSIFSVLLIVIYFRNRQRKNKEIQALESDLLESEIQNKKKDLNNLVTNLSYKRKFINEIQEKLKALQEIPDDQLKENVSSLIREFTNYKNADKNVEMLQADIEKVNLSFFNKLGAKFPLLTENEKELCGLILLKLSSKDIAIIRNVTPNAIKKARQRIRKKLPISEKEKITTFLEHL